MRKFVIFFTLVLSCLCLNAQDILHADKKLSLSQIIQLSKNSPDALIAKHEFLSSHYSYESIKANNLPELSFNGTIPNFNRSIEKITQPDGTFSYVPQFYAEYSGNLKLTQNIPFTGGQLVLSSGLNRMDIYGDSTSITSFLSRPVQIAYIQPLFSYNSLKWEQKINPVRYNLARQKYIEQLETTNIDIVGLYFDLLLVQSKLENAIENKNYSDTLQYFAEQSYRSGKMVETEYLQVELNSLQSALQVEILRNDWRNSLQKLKQFLQYEDNETWELTIPSDILDKEIPADQAKVYALENPVYHDFKLREIESESSMVKARAENRFNADLYLAFGLTQDAAKLNRAYRNPMDQEIVTLGLNIPIWNWGKSRANIKIAESRHEITNVTIQKEQQVFEQELTLKILQFNTQKTQVDLSKRAMDIAYKRLQAQKESYLFGKSTFTDLNNSVIDKDNATITYLESLKSYWTLLYEIRQRTLYDFEKEGKISLDFDQIVDSN